MHEDARAYGFPPGRTSHRITSHRGVRHVGTAVGDKVLSRRAGDNLQLMAQGVVVTACRGRMERGRDGAGLVTADRQTCGGLLAEVWTSSRWWIWRLLGCEMDAGERGGWSGWNSTLDAIFFS